MGSENCACSGHGPRGCINLALEASPFCYTCSVLARCASPSPLEVATKALEEILRECEDPRILAGQAEVVLTLMVIPIASRALATIRGTARPAETTKEAPDV